RVLRPAGERRVLLHALERSIGGGFRFFFKSFALEALLLQAGARVGFHQLAGRRKRFGCKSPLAASGKETGAAVVPLGRFGRDGEQPIEGRARLGGLPVLEQRQTVLVERRHVVRLEVDGLFVIGEGGFSVARA